MVEDETESTMEQGRRHLWQEKQDQDKTGSDPEQQPKTITETSNH
jgi:hypothetical protein